MKTAVSYSGSTSGLKFRPCDITGIIKYQKLTTEITRFQATLKIKP
jgi:hypothetical protein